MSKKAVYNNKMVAIYVSGEDFETLLKNAELYVPVYIGTVQTNEGQLYIALDDQSRAEVDYAYKLEREAIERVRSAFKKGSVRTTKTNYSHGDKKNG